MPVEVQESKFSTSTVVNENAVKLVVTVVGAALISKAKSAITA